MIPNGNPGAYNPAIHPRSLYGSQGFLTKEECKEILDKCMSFAKGGGDIRVSIQSTWTASVEWARTRAYVTRDYREQFISVNRTIRGASGNATTTRLSDGGLRDVVQRAERALVYDNENWDRRSWHPVVDPILAPRLWSDETYAFGGDKQSALVREILEPVDTAGLLSSGELKVEAKGFATLDSTEMFRYYPTTRIAFSSTVRDMTGVGSGWAGTDDFDITRVDMKTLTSRAIDKCQRSVNPVALEPGRYTAILEPQAVADLFSSALVGSALDRTFAENPAGPFGGARPGTSKIGDPVLDSRITISSDPMDPLAGFVPFRVSDGIPYSPATWVDSGTCRALAYEKIYALTMLGLDKALLNPQSWRISGGTTSVNEMITTTKRGVLVTRLQGVNVSDLSSWTCTGYTRDGLWLIENGKISKPIKNFRFVESPFFIFNKLEQLGQPQRVYSGEYGDRAWIAPAVKVNDFNFTQLTDAV